tara:strand:- start:651 stop:1697 length:1047 start_codon:yes stop_codon:yes gene_type:complete
MPFFKQFPKIEYDYNRTGTVQQIINIFRSVRTQSRLFDNTLMYKEYTIQGGMRPDVVSEKLYGTSDYYWTFFIINDFLHDGLQAWPMGEMELSDYLNKTYEGLALQFTPSVSNVVKNSIAGKLEIGGLMYGLRSGATGRIIRKDVDLGIIVLRDIIPGSLNRNPITGAADTSIDTPGSFIEGEDLQSFWPNAGGGVSSLQSDKLSPNKIYSYLEAPCYYYIDSDPEQRPITSPSVIQSLDSKGDAEAFYSELQWNNDLQSQISSPRFNKNLLNETGNVSYIATNTSPSQPLTYSGGYRTGADKLVGGITFKSNLAKIREQNDERSFIKVINPNFIVQFVEEFERLINV